jgi:hypothetical protein
MRRARVDEAERSEVISDMRGAEYARLEMLQEALAPLLAEVPKNLDLFDVAIMPGSHPRLFIDMIGFVEINRDLRGYRLVQDTRHGRFMIAETANLEVMVDAIADYMGRRLIEREKALAADRSRFPMQLKLRAQTEPIYEARPQNAATFLPNMFKLFSFLIEVLGSAAFFTLFAIGGFYAWKVFASLGATHFKLF